MEEDFYIKLEEVKEGQLDSGKLKGEKPSTNYLPTKTKMAGIIILTLCGLFTFLNIWFFLLRKDINLGSYIYQLFTPFGVFGYTFSIIIEVVLNFVSTVLLALFALFILRRKGWAWVSTVVLLSIICIWNILVCVFFIGNLLTEEEVTIEMLFSILLRLTLYITPFFLLLIDRENFFSEEKFKEVKEEQIIFGRGEGEAISTSLPTKTKIAAWWTIITTVSGVLFYMGAFMNPQALSEAEIGAIGIVAFFYVVLIPLGILICILSIFLLKRKKLAWWGVVVIFSVFSIFGLMVIGNTIAEFAEGPVKEPCTLGGVYYEECPPPYEFVRRTDLGDVFRSLIFLSPLVPSILLLLDRKKFWNIVT